MSAGRRRRAHRFGLRAETLAMLYLMLKGYQILDKRFHAAGGEIDLIAKRRDVVAFIEVKAREDLENALSAITQLKRRRISRAARAWVSRHEWAMRATLRADAVFLAPGRWPRHLQDAFALDF